MRFSRSMSVIAVCILALSSLVISIPASAQQTASEKEVWNLEHAYWSYVKANDLKSYRTLWNVNFLGWPMSSPSPARKNQITGWITSETDKGLRLKSCTLKFAASQSFGNIVVDHYWATTVWTGKNGDLPPETSRLMHTWMRVGSAWQIIDGMSAPEPHPQN